MEDFFEIIALLIAAYGIYRLYLLCGDKNKETTGNDTFGTHKTYQLKVIDKSAATVSEVLERIMTSTYLTSNEFDELNCKVAGITFHDYSDYQSGTIYGFTQEDFANPHDSNAIKLTSWDGKHLGFIPRSEKEDFFYFAKGSTSLPFMCFISSFINEDGELRPTGDLSIYNGEEESIRRFLSKCLSRDFKK